MAFKYRKEAEDILAGKWVEEMSDQITAELHLVGEPHLKSKRVIIVNNVGKYSGRYYTKSVHHSNDGGYTTIAYLSRNSGFEDKAKYSKENIDTLINKNRLSNKEFLELVQKTPKGKYYSQLFRK